MKKNRKNVSNAEKVIVFIRDTLLSAVIALLIFIVVIQFFQVGVVDGESMMPTYENGQRVLIKKRFKTINRNDVIAFSYQQPQDDFYQETYTVNGMAPADDYQLGELHIKRVVGVPGDSVIIEDGSTYINNNLISTTTVIPLVDQNYILGDNQYFIVGDNYDNSYDSRQHGPITPDEIFGKVLTGS